MTATVAQPESRELTEHSRNSGPAATTPGTLRGNVLQNLRGVGFSEGHSLVAPRAPGDNEAGSATLASNPTIAPIDEAPGPHENEDPLVRSIRESIQRNGGLEVAVYSQVGRTGLTEIESRARGFAVNHATVGIGDDGALVIGQQEAAMHEDRVSGVVSKVQATVQAVREALGDPGIGIQTLALFAHGQPDWLGFRPGLSTGDGSVDTFAEDVDSALSGTANVILYACSAAGNASKQDWYWRGGRAVPGSDHVPTAAEQEEAQRHVDEDEAQQGEGSLSDQLRDALTTDEGDEGRTVWGHRMWGNSTGNPSWRRFEGRQAPGEVSSTSPLEAVRDDRWRSDAAASIRDELRAEIERRITTDSDLRLLDDDRLQDWAVRELPFSPIEQLTTVEDGAVVVAPGLVTWLADRYQEQRPTRRYH